MFQRNGSETLKCFFFWLQCLKYYTTGKLNFLLIITSRPSNFLNTLISPHFIQFNFNNLTNTQFNLSHFGFIYLVSVFANTNFFDMKKQ